MIAPARHIPRSGTGRLLLLRARGQRLASSLAAVVALSLLFGALRQWASYAAEGGWGEWEITKQFALVQVISALLAGVIGMSVWSPLGESERTAAFPHWKLRVIQVVFLTAFALAISLPLLAGWESRTAGLSLVAVLLRNLAALIGVALLLGSAFDARWCWVGPMGCVALVMAQRIFRMPPGVLWQGEWLAAPQDDVLSWVLSAIIVTGGMTVFLRYGPRDAEGESD